MADRQGKRISSLVRTMIRKLDAYRGSILTRHHYTVFRQAKRELFAIRPDIAPSVLKLVVAKTHWSGRGSSIDPNPGPAIDDDDGLDFDEYLDKHDEFDHDSFVDDFDVDTNYDIDFWLEVDEYFEDYEQDFEEYEKLS